jgi:hypothetical protein
MAVLVTAIHALFCGKVATKTWMPAQGACAALHTLGGERGHDDVVGMS